MDAAHRVFAGLIIDQQRNLFARANPRERVIQTASGSLMCSTQTGHVLGIRGPLCGSFAICDQVDTDQWHGLARCAQPWRDPRFARLMRSG